MGRMRKPVEPGNVQADPIQPEPAVSVVIPATEVKNLETAIQRLDGEMTGFKLELADIYLRLLEKGQLHNAVREQLVEKIKLLGLARGLDMNANWHFDIPTLTFSAQEKTP